MSTHLLLFLGHYEKRKGDDWEDMTGYEDDREEWIEDPENPSRDIRDRKKDEPDSKDERKCSKSETDKSE